MSDVLFRTVRMTWVHVTVVDTAVLEKLTEWMSAEKIHTLSGHAWDGGERFSAAFEPHDGERVIAWLREVCGERYELARAKREILGLTAEQRLAQLEDVVAGVHGAIGEAPESDDDSLPDTVKSVVSELRGALEAERASKVKKKREKPPAPVPKPREEFEGVLLTEYAVHVLERTHGVKDADGLLAFDAANVSGRNARRQIQEAQAALRAQRAGRFAR